MILSAILILYAVDGGKVKVLQNVFNLDRFNRLRRGNIRSYLTAAAKAECQEADRDKKKSIDSDENFDGMFHVYVRSDGLAAVIISDDKYPQRVAFYLLSEVLDEFTKIHPDTSWATMAKRSGQLTSLNETFMRFQEPSEADQLMIMQKDADETAEILAKTVEKLRERQVNIGDLSEKAERLNAQSEQLFGTATIINRRHRRFWHSNSCFRTVYRSVVPSFSFDNKS